MKVLISTIPNEFKVVAIRHWRLVESKILNEYLVLRLLIIKSELGAGTAGVPACPLYQHRVLLDAGRRGRLRSQHHQASLNLGHSFDTTKRRRLRFHCYLKLIAEQMLDVVNKQLLMLHLMFE